MGWADEQAAALTMPAYRGINANYETYEEEMARVDGIRKTNIERMERLEADNHRLFEDLKKAGERIKALESMLTLEGYALALQEGVFYRRRDNKTPSKFDGPCEDDDIRW
jgi:hypothetical protein